MRGRIKRRVVRAAKAACVIGWILLDEAHAALERIEPSPTGSSETDAALDAMGRVTLAGSVSRPWGRA